MRHLALKRPPDLSTMEAPNKKRRKSTQTEQSIRVENNEIVEAPKTPPHLRGGVLAASELKALVTAVGSVAEFKALGNSVLPIPSDSSKDPINHHTSMSPHTIDYTEPEMTLLSSLSQKLDSLSHTINLLTQQEKLCMVVGARGKAALETLKQRGEQLKEICGYDSCLAWSMPEFESWYNSEEGKEILAFDSVREWSKVPARVLSKPITHVGVTKGENMNGKVNTDVEISVPNNGASHEDPSPTSGSKHAAAATAIAEVDEEDDPVLKGVCLKKRCTRHKDWFKYETQGIHSEKALARQEIERVKKEDRDVRQRAAIRMLEDNGEDEVGKDG